MKEIKCRCGEKACKARMTLELYPGHCDIHIAPTSAQDISLDANGIVELVQALRSMLREMA